MQLKEYRLGPEVGVVVRNRGPIFKSIMWPGRLGVGHFLRATCGPPDRQGWYPYHEEGVEWIVAALELAESITDAQVGLVAMSDPVNLCRTPAVLSRIAFGCDEPSISIMAASSLACKVFARAWHASEAEVAQLVRLNLFTEGVRV